MLEKIGNLAENLATNVGVSRRGFLGWAGKGALAVAGVLAVGGIAEAGKPKKGCCGGRACRPGFACDPRACECRPVRI